MSSMAAGTPTTNRFLWSVRARGRAFLCSKHWHNNFWIHSNNVRWMDLVCHLSACAERYIHCEIISSIDIPSKFLSNNFLRLTQTKIFKILNFGSKMYIWTDITPQMCDEERHGKIESLGHWLNSWQKRSLL